MSDKVVGERVVCDKVVRQCCGWRAVGRRAEKQGAGALDRDCTTGVFARILAGSAGNAKQSCQTSRRFINAADFQTRYMAQQSQFHLRQVMQRVNGLTSVPGLAKRLSQLEVVVLIDIALQQAEQQVRQLLFQPMGKAAPKNRPGAPDKKPEKKPTSNSSSARPKRQKGAKKSGGSKKSLADDSTEDRLLALEGEIENMSDRISRLLRITRKTEKLRAGGLLPDREALSNHTSDSDMD